MRAFLKNLIWSSEKAASLARACRKENDLFQLLVEEKIGNDKNTNSSHDFKTLADVLIQEALRHDLGSQYPQLADNILGEESNKFTNTLGESVVVKVCESQDKTSQLLGKVLDGNTGAADILAKLVHSQVTTDLEDLGKVPDENCGLDFDDLGIWIDPIDGTNNYVRGKEEQDAEKLAKANENGDVVSTGLPVVTILIGVFKRSTGVPVAGVINQPFARYDKASQTWSGKIHWGCDLGKCKYTSLPQLPSRDKPKIVLSLKAVPGLVKALESHFDIVRAGGAGYKILCVAVGLVDLYVTSKPSTYKWDTCSGQALLLSLGGGCVEFEQPENSLVYNKPNDGEGIERWCNDKGLIAFRNQSDLESLRKHMAKL